MLLNRNRAERIMAENRLEALVATSPANVFYSSDLCPYGETYVLLPVERGAEPAIVASISAPIPVVAMSRPWIGDVRYFGEFYTEARFAKEPLDDAERGLIAAQESWEETRRSDPTALLLEVIEERGLTAKSASMRRPFRGHTHSGTAWGRDFPTWRPSQPPISSR
jgi:hypothetical protein